MLSSTLTRRFPQFACQHATPQCQDAKPQCQDATPDGTSHHQRATRRKSWARPGRLREQWRWAANGGKRSGCASSGDGRSSDGFGGDQGRGGNVTGKANMWGDEALGVPTGGAREALVPAVGCVYFPKLAQTREDELDMLERRVVLTSSCVFDALPQPVLSGAQLAQGALAAVGRRLPVWLLRPVATLSARHEPARDTPVASS